MLKISIKKFIFLLFCHIVNGDNANLCDSRVPSGLKCCCANSTTGGLIIDCFVSETTEITTATWKEIKNDEKPITELYIRGNIAVIPVGLFQQVTQLQTAQFLDTKIIKIPENTFSGLTRLRELFLSFNRIEVIDANTVCSLPVLKILSVSNNVVQTIAENAFVQLPELVELHLHTNRLTVLPAHLFDELDKLKILTLHNNRLMKFDKDMLLPIMKNFHHEDSRLWLQVNKLQCDCNIFWLFDLYQWSKSETMKFYLKNLHCYTRANLMGEEKVKFFDYPKESFCRAVITTIIK